jgi:hypothetical protein
MNQENVELAKGCLFPLFKTEFYLNCWNFYVAARIRFKILNGRNYLGLINLGVRETCCEFGGDMPLRPLLGG